MKSFVYRPDAAVVSTDCGKVRGYICDGISVFKGIPYATAKRFHAPQAPEPWEGIFDATSFGYVCPLMNDPKPQGEVYVPHRYWPMNENCQNLNIWTPAADGAKRPVLVWLHGGGFTDGSAIEHIAYEGENMARFGDVVAVSINHRLNLLGYLDLSDFGDEYENSGNAGGDDIIAALGWIHRNIEAFGGDPDNVTVFGQSGGGGKVTTLLQSPAADGLFAKGINMSGVIGSLLPDTEKNDRELAGMIMKDLGITDVKDLETLPYPLLAASCQKAAAVLRSDGRFTGFAPHRNRHYAGDPQRCGFRRESAHIPMLVGSVFGEFSSFAPMEYSRSLSEAETADILKTLYGDEAASALQPLFAQAYPERPPIDIVNLDTLFRLPEIGYIRRRSALNSCTYSYLFNQDFPIDEGRTPWHCSDIPFVFHNTCFTPYTTIPGVTELLEKQIFDSVIAFARTGNPNNPSIPEWKPSAPGQEHTMIFDSRTRSRVNFDHEIIPALAGYQQARMQRLMREEKLNIQH